MLGTEGPEPNKGRDHSEAWRFSPYVLAGAIPKPNRGRRKLGYRPKRGPHPWYTTYVLISGQMDIEILGQTHQLRDSGCIVIPPGTLFDLHLPPASDFIWYEWGVNRRALSVRSQSRGYRLADTVPEPLPSVAFGQDWPIVLPDELYETSLQSSRYIACEWWKSQYAWLSANTCLSQWVLSVMYTHAQSLEVREPAELDKQRLKQVALENMPNIDNIEVWADLLGVSVKTLDRMCQKYFSQTSLNVFNELRAERVQEVLIQPHVTVSAVAGLLGFSSTASFSRWFKSYFHVTPTAWRKHVGARQYHNAMIKGLDQAQSDFDQVR